MFNWKFYLNRSSEIFSPYKACLEMFVNYVTQKFAFFTSSPLHNATVHCSVRFSDTFPPKALRNLRTFPFSNPGLECLTKYQSPTKASILY